MGFPSVGTVRHVIVNQQSEDTFYWVTWEQFRFGEQPKWTSEKKNFETREQAKSFSLAL